MKCAIIFPGQGSQFPGMGKLLYETDIAARAMFEKANDLLGFRISDIMFTGTQEDLKQTRITQPAIFIHSVIAFKTASNLKTDMVAGHSLGEISGLVANGSLNFENGLNLVVIRANAMQKACELQSTVMAAVIGMSDDKVEEICHIVFLETGEIVVPANYNCPGQLVISGSFSGIEIACKKMRAAGAKRAIVLEVGGAFHSPFMEPAREELAAVIQNTEFLKPLCPIYQNVCAEPVISPLEIKKNLINQLTSAVKWTQSVQAMIRMGADKFIEIGPGKILQGLVQKIDGTVEISGIN